MVGLRLRASLLAGGGAALIATAAGALLLQHFRTTWRGEILDQQRVAVSIAGHLVADHFRAPKELLAALAAHPAIGRAAQRRAWGDLQASVEAIGGKGETFATLFVLDPAGVMRAHTDPAVLGQDFSHRDYFQGVRRTGQLYISTPYIGRATREPTVALAVPLPPLSAPPGYLVGTLTLRHLSEALAQKLPHGLHTQVIGPEGMVLIHPDPGRRMRPADPADPAVARALAGERGEVEWTDGDGNRLLSAFASVPGLPWCLITTQLVSAIEAPLRAATRRAVVLGLLATAVASLLGAGLAGGAVGPVLRLREAARRLAAGDLAARAGLVRRDELGQLGAAFDAMASRIEAMRAELHARLAELDRRNRELSQLQRMDQEMLRGAPLQEILDAAVRGFAELAGAVSCALVRPEPQTGLLELLAVYAPDPAAIQEALAAVRPRAGEGALGLAIASREPVLVPDVATDARIGRVREPMIALGWRGALAVPLIVGQDVWGALALYFPAPRPFPSDEVNALQTFANQVAVALQAAQLREEAAARRRAEEQNRLKSLFLANMSHELRTPLNAVLGFAEVLQDQVAGPLTEKQARYVRHIHQGGQHLLNLINDILDLSKAEAGRITLAPERLSPAETCQAAIAFVRSQADKKHIALQVDLAEDLPAVVWADPSRLKQVLYNLLSNAVKFTTDGGTVTLTARRVAGPQSSGPRPGQPAATDDRGLTTHGDFVEIAVQDTGAGIRPEDQPKLFQEFARLQTPGVAREEGTGLGLAISKRLVELHGGRIWVESAGEGQGSTFTFTLPTAIPVQGRVLVIEDDAAVQEGVRAALAQAGYEAVGAATGAEGLARWRAEAPACVILEVGLPDTTGTAVLREALDDPAFPRVPVILTSGRNSVTVEDGQRWGAAAFLTKPFSQNVLLATLEQLLRRG